APASLAPAHIDNYLCRGCSLQVLRNTTNPSQHLIYANHSFIHHAITRTHLHPGGRIGSSVAAQGCAPNGGKVTVVAVCVTHEEGVVRGAALPPRDLILDERLAGQEQHG